MFLELNQMAMEQQAANGGDDNNNNINENEDVGNRVDAKEKHLPHKKDNQSFKGLLDWWHLKNATLN